ncbi:hypothetical protein GC090_20155 (plasmid) [Pantoea sp. JZ29]|uniref:hypothetical protein n=1 Tax=Pantoea sp. JZ29 TaxID=2654192 RepID=UPI002B49CB9E|nr:hypothetical protein [Pantoea sp. JZ29]WRH22983.1 hypothetical protein GC090_20155 [Pantoea sp. JZ29]
MPNFINELTILDEGELVISLEDGKTYYGAPLAGSMGYAIPTLFKKEVKLSLKSSFDLKDLYRAYYARAIYKTRKDRPVDNFIISLYTVPCLSDSSMLAEIRMNIKETEHSVTARTAGLWAPLDETGDNVL